MVRPPRPESAARMTGAAASLMWLFGCQSGGRGERLADQLRRLLAPIERDEGTKARPLVLAQQHFVERLEPRAQLRERMALADLIDLGLQGFGIGIRRRALEIRQQLGQRSEERRVGKECSGRCYTGH